MKLVVLEMLGCLKQVGFFIEFSSEHNRQKSFKFEYVISESKSSDSGKSSYIGEWETSSFLRKSK